MPEVLICEVEVTLETKYAKFWKCALQVNPWSYSLKYQGKDHGLSEQSYNSAIAMGCQQNEIKVIGLADHGNVQSSETLRKALQDAGIVVFPGFEITSTEKVHMVCLFAEGTEIATLHEHLGSVNSAEGRETSPSTLSCLDIANKVHERGGFWYAAHATAANGLLRLNQDGGGLTHIWRDCVNVLAAQIPGDLDSLEPNIQAILRNKDPNYHRTRPIALLNAKDVRTPQDLGDPSCFCWAKMTSPTIHALKLACQDAESRVRLSRSLNISYYSHIENISVTQGYLKDLKIDFSPNLNAIVGGRGTGKTTLIEGLRYALGLKPINNECDTIHNSIIEANFESEQAVVEITVTSFHQNSETYLIRKECNEPARVYDSNQAEVQLSPSDLLPRIEIYGQNELLSILKDEQEKSALLARFLQADPETEKNILLLAKQLQEHRAKLDAAEQQLQDVTESLQKLPQLSVRERSFKKLGIEKQLGQIKARESERAFSQDSEGVVESMTTLVSDLVESLEGIEVPERPAESSDKHVSKLKELENATKMAKRDAVRLARGALTAIESANNRFQVAKAKLAELWVREEAAFNKQVSKLPATRGKSIQQLTTEYKTVSKSIADLKPLQARKTQHETKLRELTDERAALLARIHDLRSQRLTSLKKSVRALNKRLDGLLKVEFHAEGIRQPLKEFLLKCRLEGVAEKRLSWIDECQTFSLIEFVSATKQGADALVDKYKDARIPRQTAEALAGLSSRRLRELEEIALPERLELFLNVTADRTIFREVNTLSTGQRCTAVLHLLLLDNPDPLIIDQPEDNLDNAFIADHIVKVIRTSKTNRQFIFATHNANIPVFGDAEWIGVLSEEDQRAKLKACGSIDAPEVKDLATNILEGGKEAFNRRREKYGL